MTRKKLTKQQIKTPTQLIKNAKWKNSEFAFCIYILRHKPYMTDGYEMRGAIYMEGPLLIESIWKANWKVSF